MTEAMTAWVIHKFGGPEAFEAVQVPKPVPGPDEVLIEVKASSVNPVDYKLRRGDLPPLTGELPVILHPDCAGVVVAIGTNVTRLTVDDEVYSFANGLVGKAGALADYMVADARMVARKPNSLTFAEAAALPLVSVTAWYCLIDRAEVGPNDTVLIQGGTGGVGHIALQLARWCGARVFATCGSDEKCRIAEELGAIKAFNYQTTTAAEIIDEVTDGQGFDMVFNTPGTPSIDHSVAVAKFGGLILDILGEFPTKPGSSIKWLTFKSVFAGRSIIQDIAQESYGRILDETARLVDEGALKPLIDPKRFTFYEVGQAHRHAEFDKPTGKVVLTRY